MFRKETKDVRFFLKGTIKCHLRQKRREGELGERFPETDKIVVEKMCDLTDSRGEYFRRRGRNPKRI